MTLAETIADLYPTSGDIRRLLDEARIPAGHVALDEPAINVWSRAIERARHNQQLPDLVGIALREYPRNERLRAAWDRDFVERRAAVAQTGDAAMSLLIDLIWETRSDQKDARQQLSELRHDAKDRLTALELLAASLKVFQEGQAARIAALEDRPQAHATQIVLALALLAGAIGGLSAAWGRMAWTFIQRSFGG